MIISVRVIFLLLCTYTAVHCFEPHSLLSSSIHLSDSLAYNSLLLSNNDGGLVEKAETVVLSAEKLLNNAQISFIQTFFPVDQEDFYAVFLAESVSGVAGGFATHFVSIINGNKNSKKRGFFDAGAASGAYFGFTAAIRTTVKTLGASPILIDILAFTFAVCIAQIFQFRRQLIRPQRKRVAGGPTMYELMKFKEPSMLDMMKFAKDENCQLKPRSPITGEVCRVEFGAEFVKWFCYYTLLVARSPVMRAEDAALLGAAIGATAQFVREKDDRRLALEIAASARARQERITAGSTYRRFQYIIEQLPGIRYFQAAIEGATQLTVYELSKQYVISVAPYFETALT